MSNELPSKSVKPVARDGRYYDWLEYDIGKNDLNGHPIESIHARSDEFIIYFCKTPLSDLYYECTDPLLEKTGLPNATLAKVNRLLPDIESERRTVLEFVADAFEMWLCGQYPESQKILDEIVAELANSRETRGRLNYQAAALTWAGVVWVLFFIHQAPAINQAFPALGQWLLAAALGATGGFFSVCLNLASIKVDVNQSLRFLWFAGATRAGVALLAAVACLLAIQGKIILGLAGAGDAVDYTDLKMIPKPIFFFLFLAGFSETFIPNVLRDSEKNVAVSGGKTAIPTT